MPNKIPFFTKLTYGFGSIAYGVKDNGFTVFLLLFYNQMIGLSADKVGFVIMIALFADAFVDLAIGHFSDHMKSRWGRRHPFMYASAIPVALAYMLLWNPPMQASESVQLLYLFVTALIVRTAISCYEVPSAALAPELTKDYHERTSVLSYRFLFGWVGGMGMYLITFLIFLRPTEAYPVGQLNPHGYQAYATVASVVMFLAIMVSALGTHRYVQKLPRPEYQAGNLKQTLKGVLATLNNKAFVVLLLSGVFSYTNQGLHFILSTYLNTFVWMFNADFFVYLTIAIMIGVLIAFFMANLFSKRYGKRLMTVVFGLLFTFISAIPYVLYYFDIFFKPGDPRLLQALMIYEVCIVAFSVSAMILGASMMSDVVEDSESKTGKRSEGLFFAGSFFMQKCVSGIGAFLSGAILAYVAFPVSAVPGSVDQSILNNLVLTYVVITTVLGVISALIIYQFPISQHDHETRVAELHGRSS